DFVHAQMIVQDTQPRIERPQDLSADSRRVSTGSLFYDFIDARRRPSEHLDDLRAWRGGWGLDNSRQAQRLAALDWQSLTVNELREQVAALCAAHLGGDQA